MRRPGGGGGRRRLSFTVATLRGALAKKRMGSVKPRGGRGRPRIWGTGTLNRIRKILSGQISCWEALELAWAHPEMRHIIAERQEQEEQRRRTPRDQAEKSEESDGDAEQPDVSVPHLAQFDTLSIVSVIAPACAVLPAELPRPVPRPASGSGVQRRVLPLGPAPDIDTPTARAKMPAACQQAPPRFIPWL